MTPSYTVWRSVLSNRSKTRSSNASLKHGLNAPFGAWCFLTRQLQGWRAHRLRVLMHLMALSAFYPYCWGGPGEPDCVVVLMHLMRSVLSDAWRSGVNRWRQDCRGLMHRLAPGAFSPTRPSVSRATGPGRLNAPYGTRCFLTDRDVKPTMTAQFMSKCTLWRSVLSHG